MKILILGGSGMIGHQVYKCLSKKYEVMVTLRSKIEKYKKYDIFFENKCFFNTDANNFSQLEKKIKIFNPDYIVNCIGITKQKITNTNINDINYINTELPKKIALLCEINRMKLIHLSTDCVFSGKRGFYSEIDNPDPEDAYGKSKLNGEINFDSSVITLRKSTIGFELEKKHGLLEWFISQEGDIEGYKNAIFSGISTIELANVIDKIIDSNENISGLWHIAGPKISKHELLCKVQNIIQKKSANILLNESFKCDRTLDGSNFNSLINYQPPSWDDMLEELFSQSI
tara:strand:- start:2322 stop:3182 length:861 start_codon:yes stop_codon:yes gene_type:complete